MFYSAALLIIGVGLMHSVLGHTYVVAPITRLENIPALFGSKTAMRRVLTLGWHITTLFWWFSAAALIALAIDADYAKPAFLLSIGVPCAISGIIALIVFKGRHVSYIFFLPTALICIWAAVQ